MMIEIMGPSGVGKSTALKRVADARADGCPRWLAPWDLEEQQSIMKAEIPAKERTAHAVDSHLPRDFMRLCFSILATSCMLPSQKFGAAVMLRKTCEEVWLLSGITPRLPVVHDELLLHRAFSFLPYASDLEREAEAYFRLVPVPAAACVFRAPADLVVARALARGKLPNFYSGLDRNAMRTAVEKALVVCEVAVEILAARNVAVHIVDAGQDVAHVEAALEQVIDSRLGKADGKR